MLSQAMQSLPHDSLEVENTYLYRQLASALHPDRDRKTALMKSVNTAYERKDLTALLTEQHKALQEDIYNQRMAMAHEFGYAPHRRFREAELQEWILAAQQRP